MQIENIKNNIRYGLKMYSLFGHDKHKDIHKIYDAKDNIVLTKPGIYHIECVDDVIIEHNVFNGLLHIVLETKKDNLNINIIGHGEMLNLRSDISHIVSIKNKNTNVNIKFNSVIIEDSHLIYRSDIISSEDASGEANQKANILNLSDFNRIDIIPGTNVSGTNMTANHAMGISNIDYNILYFLSLYGYDMHDGSQYIINSFLNRK